MLRALSIETSGRIGSVALSQDAAIVAAGSFTHGLQHAARLLPMIDGLCRERGWAPGDIDHIYLSIGPGSFTGLRIGVTLTKTLAMAIGARIVAVPSTRVLAENLPAAAVEGIVVIDAKRGQIFTARYGRATVAVEWSEIEPPHLDTLAAMLARAGRPVHLIGEGLAYHRSAVPDDAGIIMTAEETWQASAAAVAKLGAALALQGNFADVYALKPTYIRLPEAEEKRLEAEAANPPSP